MKTLIVAALIAFGGHAIAAEPVSAKTTPNPVVEPAKNDNCVKKDKAGKCPPLPNSPKPTPKKKAEAK